MILDNENTNKKVYQWIVEYTKNGIFNAITGYFTIGALNYIAEKINDRINEFNFFIGDIVHTDEPNERPLDLLNENIVLESALNLSQSAKRVIEFLKQDKVKVRTLEPNFCHAKLYIFQEKKDAITPNDFYIMGSSNLTEAGIGLKQTNNVELNIVGQGTEANYKELREWFKNLSEKQQRYDIKTIDGKKVNFKEYLISEIEKIFKEYSPKDLYFKVLFELFGEGILADKLNPNLNRQIGHLENTIIYKSLYEFQKKGVLSLIKMLQNYNGAILADAVGLGKTWSALAVIKFFILQGYEVILLCPKKLEHNWRKFLRKYNSKFEDDNFDYTIRFHTDLQGTRLEKDGLTIKDYFQSDKPKLLVIDESHNLRNSKSNRYKFLVENILKPNKNIKVLMLSATPINTSFLDIRNQFKLMVKDDEEGFKETLGIKNIDTTFKVAQREFTEWRKEDKKTIGGFIRRLPADFFKLTDSLTVARTRKMIEGQTDELKFPIKNKPYNLFITPKQIGKFNSFEEMFDNFPPMLSGYQPAFYIKQEEDVEAIENERLRDRFLVKMMYILMVKRLESSWYSFKSTVEKILIHHQNALERIIEYEKAKQDCEIDTSYEDELPEDEEETNWDELDEYTLGKRRKIKLSDIDRNGKLQDYKSDLAVDIESLKELLSNLNEFEKDIELEKKKNNYKSKDEKLEKLIKIIQDKQKSSKNNNNKKVLIFTVYKDSAFYLFEQLLSRGFTNLAVVSGDEAKDSNGYKGKKFEDILERFAPYTKLFKEKQWKDFEPKNKDDFNEWKKWIEINNSETFKKLQAPIDILIATDCLSEGQNLQDCDMVINYDIHWNPVRVIQRMGRIDRLGSINNEIFGINFWPSDNINRYLDLQDRIEDRMIAMKLAGAELPKDFTKKLKQKFDDDRLDREQAKRMMAQMQTTFDDIEVSDETIGFDDLSLETFRQDLIVELNKEKDKYSQIPKGVYTGFKKDINICSTDGIIALLGYPAKPQGVREHIYKDYHLIYIDYKGESVLLNQKDVLNILSKHKDEKRFVPASIDKGEPSAIKQLADAMKSWIDKQAGGQATLELLNGIANNDSKAINLLQGDINFKNKYQTNNFDLIVWFLVG